MTSEPVPFREKAVRPLECYKESWRLIRGQYWLFASIYFVGMVIAGMAPLAILLGPILCGLVLCMMKRARGEPMGFGTLFEGFDMVLESLVATLLTIVPLLLVIVPAYLGGVVLFVVFMRGLEHETGLEPGSFFVRLLLIESPILLSLLLAALAYSVLTAFLYPLIAERRLKAIEAIRVSARAAVCNLGGLLLLFVLNFVAMMLGFLLCYVGIFLIAPIVFGAKFSAYRQVFIENKA